MWRLPARQGAAYKELARRLQLARLEAGLTQEEVSALIEKPQSFISRLESGERRIDVVELSHLAKLYKKDLAFFDVTDEAGV